MWSRAPAGWTEAQAGRWLTWPSVRLQPRSGSPAALCGQRLIESPLATQVVAFPVQMSAGFLVLLDRVAVAAPLTGDGLEWRRLAPLGLPGGGPSTLPRLCHLPSSGARLRGGPFLPPPCTSGHRCPLKHLQRHNTDGSQATRSRSEPGIRTSLERSDYFRMWKGRAGPAPRC